MDAAAGSDNDAGEINLTLLAVALNLTPLLARIVATMLQKPACSTAELRAAVNPNLSVYISRLREKLAPLGVKVESLYGVGYVIGPESREIIRERMRRFEPAAA